MKALVKLTYAVEVEMDDDTLNKCKQNPSFNCLELMTANAICYIRKYPEFVPNLCKINKEELIESSVQSF